MTDQVELQTIRKLEGAKEAADKGYPMHFTPEEAEVLQRFARVLMGFETLGRVALFVKGILGYIGWAVGLYFAYKAGLIEWLKGAVR